jgi:hypothetical protein
MRFCGRRRRIELPRFPASVLLLAAAAAPGVALGAGGYFTEITKQSGLTFVHETGGRGALEMPEIMGAGVAIFDYDKDSDLDLYFTNGSFELSDPSSGKRPWNRLYRREAGGTYTDVTEESGLGDAGYGMGIAIGDYDGDDFPDVFLTNFGSVRLYRNRGDGTFEDVTARARISTPGWPTSASFFDFDRDRDLDLFVVRYVEYSSQKKCTDPAGRPEYCGPKEFPPMSSVLLRNEGDGTFRDVSETAGISSVKAAGLGVVCEDVNDDLWTDVYVANDAYANHLWINQGDGTFLDDALLLGAAFNLQGMAEAGMGLAAADFDRDLDFDLLVTNLRNEHNTLYLNLGPGVGFEDRTAEWNLAAASMQTTGFGTAAFDADLDGRLDIFVANGSVNRGNPWKGVGVPAPWDRYAEPSHLYLQREGHRFELAAEEAGDISSHVELARGAATGDLDEDGDIDLVVATLQGPARIYRNDAPRRGKWLLVDARDDRGRALGARVTVRAGGKSWVGSVNGGSSYLSASDDRAHFGLGEVDSVQSLEVRWPGGRRELFPGGPANRTFTLERGKGESLP